MLHIPFSCGLLTVQNLSISGHAGFPGNIRLHGIFRSQKVNCDSNRVFFPPAGGLKTYVKNHKFLKSRNADKHDSVLVPEDNQLKKELIGLPTLLRKHLDNFLE